MSLRRGTSVAIFLVALACNWWLLRSNNILLGISFAVLCLSMSWALASAGQKAQVQERKAPQRYGADPIPFAKQKQAPGGEPLNAFTIDLEDYFHTEVSSRSVKYDDWDKMPSRIEYSTHRLLDTLDEHNTQATVFVLGWVAQRYPRLVREVARRGHEIGCHSFRHRLVYKLTPQVFAEDTRIAKQVIEDLTGTAVEGYRAPSFSITPGNEWAFKVLEQSGFVYDSSVNPIWHTSYANTRAPRFPYFIEGTRLLEIPIATWRIGRLNLPVGGGAYLRLLPYPYIRYGLSTVNRREHQPATLYVHPWEIDYHQPEIHKEWTSHVRQMWGTRTMEAKLGHLLSSSRFGPISHAYAHSLPTNSPILKTLSQQTPSFAQVS